MERGGKWQGKMKRRGEEQKELRRNGKRRKVIGKDEEDERDRGELKRRNAKRKEQMSDAQMSERNNIYPRKKRRNKSTLVKFVKGQKVNLEKKIYISIVSCLKDV